MIRIENPLPGKRSEISLSAAERMLALGSAVESARVNGELFMIRLVAAAGRSNPEVCSEASK